MYSLLRQAAVASCLTVTLIAAQFFPATPEDTTVLKSKFHDGVTISYKEVSIRSHVTIYMHVLAPNKCNNQILRDDEHSVHKADKTS